MHGVIKKFKFEAAHSLPGYDGKCSEIHGHTWTVEVCVNTVKLDSNGFVIDFNVLEGICKKIKDVVDHSNLNDTFRNPTAETLAEWIYSVFSSALLCFFDVRVNSVAVWEGEDNAAVYVPEGSE